MEIQWHGHSCIRMKSAQGTVLTDPYHPDDGRPLVPLDADIVLVAGDHAGHDPLGPRAGSAFQIMGPGEYEVRGIFVTGVRMAQSPRRAADSGLATLYAITLEGLTVSHLGNIDNVPSQELIEALGSVDVLLLPVGGGRTLSPSQAAEVVNLMEPSIVIPMHFRSAEQPDLRPVEAFLTEMGVDAVDLDPAPVVVVASNRLPIEPQVMVPQAQI